MRVEVLYFRGCPNHPVAIERLRQVLEQEQVKTDIAELEIRDDVTAEAAGFLGSPTVRVNGLDVEPGARAAQGFGLSCRTYLGDAGREGAPSVEMIRQALREVLRCSNVVRLSETAC